MKYMIMECHPGYAVALDRDGNFVKVANRQYKPGQLVTEVIPMRQPPEKKGPVWPSALVAVAACLALLMTMLLPISRQPYACVYVKINPEVRIDVDDADQVIGLAGVNPDGETLIGGYDFRHKDLTLVTNELVDLAIAMGYLREDGQVTLRLDSEDAVWVDSHCQYLSSHLQSHLQATAYENIQIELHHESGHDHGHTQETGADTHGHGTTNASEPLATESPHDSSHEPGHEGRHHGKDGNGRHPSVKKGLS